MFAALEDAVDTLDIPLERDAIVAAVGLRDRLDAKVTNAVGRFEAAGLHSIDGAITMAAWLRHRAGIDGPTSIRCARRAAKLQRLPVLRQAFTAGLLSGGAVDVVLAQVVNRHVARFADHETDLVLMLVGLDVDGVTRVMREWRARADALDPGPEPPDRPDTVHLSPTLADRGVLNGSLGSDLFNLLSTALRVADPGDHTLAVSQRRAMALGRSARRSWTGTPRPVTAGTAPTSTSPSPSSSSSTVTRRPRRPTWTPGCPSAGTGSTCCAATPNGGGSP